MPQPKPWKEEVKNALIELGGVAHWKEICNKIEERNIMNFEENTQWHAEVRNALQTNSLSTNYGKNDTFYNIYGVKAKKGVWGLTEIKYADIGSNVYDILQLHTVADTNQQIRETNTIKLVRNSKYSKVLRMMYKDTCQLCGIQLQKNATEFISEVHHIQPYNKEHKGDDTIRNLIVLCPNHHAQFDALYYAINPFNLKIICSDIYDEYHNKDLFMMQNNHVFEKKYLEYTWALFKKTNGINA